MTEQSFSIIAYLVAAIFFILALKGLSSPTSARQGNLFGTIGMAIAVITTFMVARKVLENWIYWLVIDGVSIYVYLDRELYFTAILFIVYIVIIFFGFRAWWLDYRCQTGTSHS